MIEIFRSDNTDFMHNGDMPLVPTSCKGKIELNGICEIVLEHPYDDIGRWTFIVEDNIIACPTPWNTFQLFRIYNVVKTITGLTAYARHFAYDIMNYVLLDVRPTAKTGQEALDIILADTPFSAHSDITTPHTAYYIRKNIMEALAGDDENSFINVWGGERFFDNYNIYINNRIGADNGVRADFGYNLTEIEEDTNIDEVVTRIIPTGYNGIMLDGASPWVDSPNLFLYSNIKSKVINFDDVKVKENPEDAEGFATLAEARTELINRCNKLFQEGIDKPVVNYKVEMAYLRNTTAYKGYEVLEEVNIGDTVHCNHTGLEIEVEARCITLEWEIDFETSKVRTTSIELGNAKPNYFDNQSDTSSKINNVLNSNGSVNALSVEGIINGLQTKFKALKDVAQTQHVRAMLFEDRDPASPTFGAMCIGTMGFQISSELVNNEWNWTTFGTGKGFIADYITAGVLSSVLIQNLDGSFKIDLSQSGGATFFSNNTKSMEIKGSSLGFYNWAKNGDYIGSLGSVITQGEPDKPYISIWNDLDSAIQIGYQVVGSPNSTYPYITFDKYGITGQEQTIVIHEFMQTSRIILDGSIRSRSKNIAFEGDNLWLVHEDSGQAMFMVDVNGTGYFRGDLGCSGTKTRVVKTTQGEVKLNAFETPRPLFADYSEHDEVLDSNGLCTVKFDPLFLETISTTDYYNVNLTKYGQGDIWIQEKNLDSFLVKGEPGLKFSWTIAARQKGYENTRLDKYEIPTPIGIS